MRIVQARGGTSSFPVTALAAAGIIAILVFAAFVTFNLMRMAQTLDAMGADFGKTNSLLTETNARLGTTNADLTSTLHRLAGTNRLLTGTNGKLTGMAQDRRLTTRELDGANGQLRLTNGTLSGMDMQMRDMAHKITHAKLLF